MALPLTQSIFLLGGSMTFKIELRRVIIPQGQVLLRAGHQANWLAVSMILLTWLDHLKRNVFLRAAQVKMVCLLVENQLHSCWKHWWNPCKKLKLLLRQVLHLWQPDIDLKAIDVIQVGAIMQWLNKQKFRVLTHCVDWLEAAILLCQELY